MSRAAARSLVGDIALLVRLGRPKFLLESVLMVTCGVAVTVYLGHPFLIGPWLAAQAFVTTTHLMTQYCNEYFDLEADSAHTGPTAWTGGSQVLAQGLLPASASLSAAFVLLFLSVVQIALMPTVAARLLCVLIVTLAWFYTAPPIRLNYRALGEVTTGAVLILLCPALACLLQIGTLPPLLFAVTIPLFLVMTARMIVMNYCDRDSDRSVGKLTLPNTLGPRRAAWLFTALQATAYAVLVAVTATGTLPLAVGVALLATVPWAVMLCRRLLLAPPAAGDAVRGNQLARAATVHAAATGYLAPAALLAAAVARHGLTDAVLGAGGPLLVYTVLFAAQWFGERRAASPQPITEVSRA
ncbi:prenyltransferase [Micromonospora sp. WMMD1120]|uniref:prenyltransferase n=1 Tax=Micromonospora sp. WMMD1120 TaxID=3016106 RepID=UPI0024166C9B|nr:prenyltransferase [Micromonospora sp. WMMD1120]MDG4810783.1 prenyltransferase [Micromonospora sp. WMMD1120]